MKVEITARLFDTCHGDYVQDWSGVVVGVPLAGQDAATMADDAAHEANWDFLPCGSADDSVLDEHVLAEITDDMIRDAVIVCLKPTARFWPVDHEGNDVTDGSDTDLQDEQPCAWFRFTVTHDCARPGDDPDVDTAIADGLCRIGEFLGTAVAFALLFVA